LIRDSARRARCRIPGPDGALTAGFNARARAATSAAPRPPAVACVDRDELRSSPRGDVIGSIGSGEPLRVLARRDGWRRVGVKHPPRPGGAP
jgi:hypothetical protein